VTGTCDENAAARQGVPADIFASGGPAAELRHWTALVMVKTDVERTICDCYGFFLLLSGRIPEYSSQPSTMKPIATPVIASQVPNLSI
jgi:hypothetical protein